MCKLCTSNGIFTESELQICKNIEVIPNTLSCLFFLNCSNNNKISIIPDSIQYINSINMEYCKNILEIPKFTYLVNLNISFTLINHIPKQLFNLVKLECEGCLNLLTLPAELTKLYFLKCSNTQICEIPDTYINLLYLYIDNTNVFNLSLKIKKIKYLNCQSSNKNIQLMNIHKKLTDLTYLNCANNNISVFNSYNNLKYLDCCNNPLYDLNKKINQIEYLNCANTFLIKLDINLSNIVYLNISNTEINELPNDMDSLTTLIISYSKIKKLPDCLENLIHLDCSFSYINKLPTSIIIANRLNYLNCMKSLIYEIPIELTNLKHIEK